MSKNILIVISFLLIGLICIGFVSNDEYIESLVISITSISVLGVLVKFIFEQIKMTIEFSYEKKKIAYDASMNSQFAYEVHSEYLEFCKVYTSKVYQITEEMFRSGGSNKCLDYSRDLYIVRKKYTVVIPETVNLELQSFEYTLRLLGAEYEFQKSTIDSASDDIARRKSIEKTHSLFLQLMDVNNKDEDRNIKNREEIISYIRNIRNTVGINKINELKHQVLDS